MKCVFIYNPQSGRGKIAKKIEFIKRRLRTVYQEVNVCITQTAEQLEEKVYSYADEYDAIVFSGGDGTFNHVLHGLKGKRVQLGYIPSGTVNDIARSLKIPRSLNGALNVVLQGRSCALDCMRINGERYAMYIAAAGAFTSATYETPQAQKRALGMLAYAVRVVKKNMKLQIFPLTIEKEDLEVSSEAVLVLTMNGRSVAGFPINRDGRMTDGKIEVAVIRQVKKPNLFQRLDKFFSLASLFLFGCRVPKKDVYFISGEKFTFRTGEDVVWDFDGEEGVRGSVTIEACPRCVRLFVPKNNKKI